MRRVDTPEILDSDACPPGEVQAALKTIGRINRWFGGVATTGKMIERVAGATQANRFSLLDVAAGAGEQLDIVRRNSARDGITLDTTFLDFAHSHLPRGNHSVVAEALRLPFADNSFDLVSCNLFAHHLDSRQLQLFLQEAFRVCRRAVLINDLIRHPLHLALVYASCPIMKSRVAWLDGLTSVRRAYLPEEIRKAISIALQPAPRAEIRRHYLYRMGVIIWKIPPVEGCGCSLEGACHHR